jgi:hypothetical protein
MSFFKKIFQFLTTQTELYAVEKNNLENSKDSQVIIPINETDSKYSEILKEIKSYNDLQEPQKKILDVLSVLTAEIVSLKKDINNIQNVLKNQNIILGQLANDTNKIWKDLNAFFSLIAENLDMYNHMEQDDTYIEEAFESLDDVSEIKQNANKKKGKFGLN